MNMSCSHIPNKPRPFARAVAVAIVLATVGFVVPARAQLYVSDIGNNHIGAYDSNTGAVIPTFSATGNYPDNLAISGNSLYVSNAAAASVNALNATTGAPLAGFNTITGLGNPSGLALSGNNLYVAQQSTNAISVYNATTGALIHQNFFTTGLNQESGLAISGNTLYVANVQAFEVSEFNLTTGVLIGNISTGGKPAALAISGNALYVTLIGFPNQTNQLEAIDLTTGLPLAGFTTITGLNPAGDAVLGNDLYVTNNNTVEEFNAATGALINSNLVSGLNTPSGLAVEAVPEASTWVIGVLAAALLLAQIVRARRFSQQQKP